jgi:uncharacterized cupin superfamily protein
MDLVPGSKVTAAGLILDRVSSADEQIIAGTPATAGCALGSIGGLEYGLWEMTPGTVTDVEADEVFVVIEGAGLLEFLDRSMPALTLAPGVIVRLGEGMNTRWTVTETLRKFYLA